MASCGTVIVIRVEVLVVNAEAGISKLSGKRIEVTLSRFSPINLSSAPRATGVGPKLFRTVTPLPPSLSFLHEFKSIPTNTTHKVVNSIAFEKYFIDFVCIAIFL